MKNLIIIIAFFSLLNYTNAQQDSTLEVNLLQAPNSPGANLIGISPSDVQQFSDPSAMAVSILSATNNFQGLPNSYAIDIAPAWMFSRDKISYPRFKSNNLKENLWQNLVVSAAITNDIDAFDINNTNLGFGIKTSLVRGAVGEQADKLMRASSEQLKIILSSYDELYDQKSKADENLTLYRAKMRELASQGKSSSDEYAAWKKAAEDRMASIQGEIRKYNDKKYTEILDSLKSIAKQIDFKRYGFKADLAAGVAFAFPSQVFDKGYLSRTGVWITLGYESKAGLSFLGLLRYLYNPDKIFADDKGLLQTDDVNTFDSGIRLLYDNSQSKFTIGSEAIYRSVLNTSLVSPTWRFTVNAEYTVSPNKILSLAIGRAYDGAFSNDGNVIAAINLLLGFGNKRKV